MNEVSQNVLKFAKLGEHWAWRQIIATYGPLLYQFLSRFARDQPETDDIYQEAFLRAYEKINLYDLSRPFKSWLMRVAINQALNYKKKNNFLTRRLTEHIDGSSTSDKLEDLDEARAALGCLSETARAVFLLYHYLCYSTAEIAEIMGLPRGTVKSHLHRSKNDLMKRYRTKED